MAGRRRRGLFARLLDLFPAEFRGDFGDDMAADFQDQRADAASRGRGSLARLWVRTSLDMIRRAPLEHLDVLRRDAGYGFRLLRRRPAFSGAVILTLAIGTGANAAVFSVVSGVLLQALPIANGDRVVRLMSVDAKAPDELNPVSSLDFLDWQAQVTTLDRMALSADAAGTLIVPGGLPESVAGLVVTEGFFDIIGATPVLGRTFTSDEYRTGLMVHRAVDQPSAAILSDGLWRRQFAASPNVVGTTFRLRGHVLTVVGVLPASVDARGLIRASDREYPSFWLPGRPNTGPMSLRRSARTTAAIGRIAPGTSAAEAQAELDRVSAALAAAYPEDAGWSVRLVRPLDTLVTGVRTQVWMLMLAAFCVLMIAAANVINLMLAHASGRRLEMATRVAIGATRAHLVRQLLTEGLVLSALGGALGVLFAYWAVPALVALAPASVPRLDGIVVDGGVLTFALLTSVAVGAACGLVAALAPERYGEAAIRSGPIDARGNGRRVRQGLTIAQVALALVLVAAAGLLVRTVRAMNAQELGFDPRNVMSVSADVGRGKSAAFVERTRQLPGVIDAGTGPRPLARATGMTVSSSPDTAGERTEVNPVTPGYLRVLRSRLIRGRLFEERDEAALEPVAIITESAARHFWPDVDPVGRLLFMSDGADTATVIGIVADIRRNGLVGEFMPVVYVLQSQTRSLGIGTVWIRTQGDPLAIVPALRAALKELAPEAPLFLRMLDDDVAAEMAPHRFMLRLVGLFSALALLLAMLGTYAVLAESVAQRVPEIGVRVALGATRGSIAGLVLSQAGWMVGAGIAMGTTAAWLLRNLMSSYVFGVPTSDGLTYGTSAIAVAVAALLASGFPARRAASIDPVVALRQE